MTALAPTPGLSSPSLAPESLLKPCIQSRGPSPTKVLVLGEAPGEQEEKLGIPFVGPSGRELDRMLHEAGWNPGSLFLTNVFFTRPQANNLATLFMSAAEHKRLATAKPLPMKIDNKLMFLHPSLLPELERLRQEILACAPNLILALGNTALWALTGRQNISSVRGTTLASRQDAPCALAGLKILPTYHPAAVLRQWNLRPIVLSDLMKAKVQSTFPEIRRPQRFLTVHPTLNDLQSFATRLASSPPPLLAVDVETRLGQITEIAFSPSASEAFVVPFIRGFQDHYWPTLREETQALELVRSILQGPVPKIFQNGLYDLQYIWKTWHFAPRACLHDTMIRHHAMYPEVQKSLGFLGSLYTSEPSWKLMRSRKDTVEKRDDE